MYNALYGCYHYLNPWSSRHAEAIKIKKQLDEEARKKRDKLANKVTDMPIITGNPKPKNV